MITPSLVRRNRTVPVRFEGGFWTAPSHAIIGIPLNPKQPPIQNTITTTIIMELYGMSTEDEGADSISNNIINLICSKT